MSRGAYVQHLGRVRAALEGAAEDKRLTREEYVELMEEAESMASDRATAAREDAAREAKQ